MITKVHISSFTRTKHRKFIAERNGCYLCWRNFGTAELLQYHITKHLVSVTVKNCNASWKSQGCTELFEFNVKVEPQQMLSFEIKNTTDVELVIKYIDVYNEVLNVAKLSSQKFPIKLECGETKKIESHLSYFCESNHIIIVYEEAKNKMIEKIQSYNIQLNDEIIQRAFPEAPPSPVEQPKSQPSIIVLRTLPLYHPSPTIKNLFQEGFHFNDNFTQNERELLHYINTFNGILTPQNYFKILSIKTQIEDYSAQVAIKGSTKRCRSLVRQGNKLYSLKLNEKEGRPLFLTKGDSITVRHNNNLNCIRGTVEDVTSKEIVMKLSGRIEEHLSCYSIHFELNRLTFRQEHAALKNAQELDMVSLLFPSKIEETSNTTVEKLEFFDSKIKSDFNQMDAVQSIVSGLHYPLPYLLIGYPGTGKTKVIVESVCQIFSNSENRILVCASSNSVCDEIADRLINLIKRMNLNQSIDIQQYYLLRLYAVCVRRFCTNNDVLEYSNFNERTIPPLSEIYKYRIVVCTLSVSGRLNQADIDPSHFTHLFIDECENADETATLIPIAGVCSSNQKLNARIILAGDPNQLGPMSSARKTLEMGLNVSMFQRLHNSDIYRRCPRTKLYNSRLICKLKNNYRAHPDLVTIPNRIFYNSEMRSCANIGKLKWLSELDFLPKKGFPILFEHIDGVPEVKEKCQSWYNEAEIQSVVYYVKRLLEEKVRTIRPLDIGVISPYKRQCIHIEEALLELGIDGVEVGSVEQFQGKEKPIIIISTVRRGNIGFLEERARINVMLTRAIGLLIIIGHKNTLKNNKVWNRVIEYTYTQCDGEVMAEYVCEEDYRC